MYVVIESSKEVFINNYMLLTVIRISRLFNFFSKFSLSMKVQILDFGDSSCWRISRMLTFLLVIFESSKKIHWNQAALKYYDKSFPGCSIFLRLHWKFKGGIFLSYHAAYSFPDVNFWRLHWFNESSIWQMRF